MLFGKYNFAIFSLRSVRGESIQLSVEAMSEKTMGVFLFLFFII